MTDKDRIGRLKAMLRSACIEICHPCLSYGGLENDYRCTAENGACFVQEWRRACGMDGGRE